MNTKTRLLRLIISAFVLCILLAQESFAQQTEELRGLGFNKARHLFSGTLRSGVPNNVVPENAEVGFELPMAFCDYVRCNRSDRHVLGIYFRISDTLATRDSPDGLFRINAYELNNSNPDFGKITLLKGGVLNYANGPYTYALIHREAFRTFSASHHRYDLTIEVSNTFISITLSDADGSPNQIAENAPADTLVQGLTLAIVDEGGASLTEDIQWDILGEELNAYTINSQGQILVQSPSLLDFEIQPLSTGNVQATINGISDMLEVSIALINILESITVADADTDANTIPENAAPDTAVANVRLEVRDEGDQALSNGIRWSLTDTNAGLFVIDSSSGVISLALSDSLDYEMTTSYTLTVSVEADVVGGDTLTEQITLAVNVDNVIEDIVIKDTNSAENIIPETMSANTEVIGLVLEARDENDNILPNESLTWSVLEPDIPLAVNPSNGMIESTDGAMFDFGGQRTYHFTVSAQVTASGGMLTPPPNFR